MFCILDTWSGKLFEYRLVGVSPAQEEMTGEADSLALDPHSASYALEQDSQRDRDPFPHLQHLHKTANSPAWQ